MGIEIRTARNDREVDEAYELASKVFGPNYYAAHDMKIRIRRLDPVLDLDDVIVAMSGNEVVGLVRILSRAVWLGGTPLSVSGMTSICIRPDFQGQGHGRAIMEAAIVRGRQRGDVLSIAFARRAVDGFYPRLGYVGLGCHPEMVVSLEPGSRPTPLAIKFSPGLDNHWVGFYEQAYRDSYQSLVMSFCRDQAWWLKAPMRLSSRNEDLEFVTVMHEEGPAGYFVVHGARVVEAASIANSQQAVAAAMLAFALERRREMTLALPLGHWAMQEFKSMNHTLKVRYSWDGGHVVRILNSSSFGRALAGVVEVSQVQRFAVLDDLGRFDIVDHEASRGLLMRVAGISSIAGVAPGGDQAVHVQPLLPTFPTWSVMDEF